MASSALHIRRLTKRAQFLRAARGRRANGPCFSLQAIKTDAAEAGVGFTVTKKTGNAPERSRIKRRLRAAVASCASHLHPQHDYVLIGRRSALDASFSGLVGGLEKLLTRIHTPRPEAR